MTPTGCLEVLCTTRTPLKSHNMGTGSVKETTFMTGSVEVTRFMRAPP